jgi:hypothetical protein
MGLMPFGLLETPPILWKAIDWMGAQGLIHDEFASTTLSRNPEFGPRVVELTKIPNTPPQKFVDLNANQQWLCGFLVEIERRATEYGITATDFERPAPEWEPIPLDRSEPELNEVIESIDHAVETVRGDNGYSENKPEERNYVLD